MSFHYSTYLSSIFFISFHNVPPYCPKLITIRLIFLPYFPYHFTFQLTFLPYFPYHFTIQPTFLLHFPYHFTMFFCIFHIFPNLITIQPTFNSSVFSISFSQFNLLFFHIFTFHPYFPNFFTIQLIFLS